MSKNRVLIFDTTLRDGEQCPGASMNLREKLAVARQLSRLKVDVIEAGFPVISDGDFTAVQTISKQIKNAQIAGLARCVNKDIDAAGAAVKPAGKRGRIHVFLATSKIHREHKLGKAQDQILKLAVDGVKRACKHVKDVEFSPEDGSRTEPDFLVEICRAVVKAGATTVNIPDTVGWAVPEEYGALIAHLHDHVPEFQNGKVAVANSLAAVKAGARQVECTVNGIGERAGNAALEEIVMALQTRKDVFRGFFCGINSKEIVKASKLVARMSGLPVQRSKAIVGENAFAHSSGIHQDGILKKRETYEIMDPRAVGWGKTELPLTKHSGRAAVAARLKHLGFKLSTSFQRDRRQEKICVRRGLDRVGGGHSHDGAGDVDTRLFERLHRKPNRADGHGALAKNQRQKTHVRAGRRHRRWPCGCSAQSHRPHHAHDGQADGLRAALGVARQGRAGRGIGESGFWRWQTGGRSRRQHGHHRSQRARVFECREPAFGHRRCPN